MRRPLLPRRYPAGVGRPGGPPACEEVAVAPETSRSGAAPAGAVPGPAQDESLMRLALAEARAAMEHGDVPVGAVLVGPDGAVLGQGRNRREQRADPTAHAELEAMRAAACALGGWRLDGTTLVATL